MVDRGPQRKVGAVLAEPLLAGLLLALLASSPPCAAGIEQDRGPQPEGDSVLGPISPRDVSPDSWRGPWDPYEIIYGTEPDMDTIGRMLSSAQGATGRAFYPLTAGGRRGWLAPVWEAPVAIFLMLVQHEVAGHGGRAREYDLDPSYGLQWDFSAFTDLGRIPETNEQMIVLSGAGTEADAIMSGRIVLDAHRPEGTEGSRFLLALFAKLDLALYVSGTLGPDEGDDFQDQYEEGNDMALYLVSRQARRAGADPADVWDGRYDVDFDDELLEDNWDDVRITALWSLLDPSMIGASYAYVKEHVVGGSIRIHAPVLRITPTLGLTAATRGALGPQEVSRFLDLYLVTPRATWGLHARDLDSSIDRAYGLGGSVSRLGLGSHLVMDVGAHAWREPRAREDLREGRGWSASAELKTRFGTHVGMILRGGAKSEGFFPGQPMDRGPFVSAGLELSFQPISEL